MIVSKDLKNSTSVKRKSKILLEKPNDKTSKSFLPFICSHCNISTKRIKAYVQHIVKEHSNQINTDGNYISTFFSNPEDMNTVACPSRNTDLYNFSWSVDKVQVDNSINGKKVSPIKIRKFSRFTATKSCEISSNNSLPVSVKDKDSKSSVVDSIISSKKLFVKKVISQATVKCGSSIQNNLPDLVLSKQISLEHIENKDNLCYSSSSPHFKNSNFFQTKFNDNVVYSSAPDVLHYNPSTNLNSLASSPNSQSCSLLSTKNNSLPVPLSFNPDDLKNPCFKSNLNTNRAVNELPIQSNSPRSSPTNQVEIVEKSIQVKSQSPTNLCQVANNNVTNSASSNKSESEFPTKQKRTFDLTETVESESSSEHSLLTKSDAVQQAENDLGIKVVSVASCSKKDDSDVKVKRSLFKNHSESRRKSVRLVDIAPKPMRTLLNSGLVTMPLSDETKRDKTVFSEKTQAMLQKSFCFFPYPRIQSLRRLSKATGLPTHELKLWFAKSRIRCGISWDPDEVHDAWLFLKDFEEVNDL